MLNNLSRLSSHLQEGISRRDRGLVHETLRDLLDLKPQAYAQDQKALGACTNG